MKVYLSLVVVTVATVLFVGAFQSIDAQSSECSELVEVAFSTLATECSSAAGNSVCKSGEVTNLSQAQVVQSTSLNLDTGEWGLAIMNVHANVPLALSERGLNYVLLGGVELENTVSQDTAFVPVEPISVTPIVGANIRSAPGDTARVLNSAAVGQELFADGLSADGNWLRIVSDTETAWISRSIVTSQTGDISSLPTISSNTQTAMQSFILRTSPSESDCAEVPPAMLVIQSPAGLNSQIRVNGLDILFNGTIVLRVLESNELQLIVVEGGATSDNVRVPAGFTMTIVLNEEGTDRSGQWTNLRMISEAERNTLTPLEGLAPDLLHNVITIPTAAEVARTAAEISRASGSSSGGGSQGPAAEGVDCSGFFATSPLGNIENGITNFYWDGAPGATEYKVNIYHLESNTIVTSFQISNISTTAAIDTGGGIGGGTNFVWEVEALRNGQNACTTARMNVVRVSAPGSVNVPESGGGGGGKTPTACPWTSC